MIGVEVIQGLSSYIARTSMFLGPLHLDMLAASPRHQEVATIQLIESEPINSMEVELFDFKLQV